MAGFRRVLCATDLGEAGDWAIRAADEEARLYGAELALLHVIPVTYPGSPMTPEGVSEAMVQDERLASEIIDQLLERAERLIGRDAGTLSVMVEDGAPDETIVHQAEEIGADLVVVGDFGGAARAHRLGGVAEAVVKRARCSVLVARPGGDPGRIVLATDFSRPAEPAAALAADEVVRRCGSIVAVHSIETVGPAVALGEPAALPPIALGAYDIDEMRGVAQQRLSRTLAQLGVAGEIEVTEGPPGEAIVLLARTHQAGLVVVGTSGLTGIDRLLLGSVALSIVREAPCSVLVARSPAPPQRRVGTAAHPAQPA
jgi:nucleotide-binding universal stress UspA family protein